MNDAQTSWCAGVYWNEKFLCVLAWSGRGRMQHDPNNAQHLLPLDAGDESLGFAVQDALAHSRLLTMEEIAVFFNLANSKARYDAWVAELMAHYDYTTRRALFKRMLKCGVRRHDGVITFSPSIKDRLEAWRGPTKDEIAQGMVDEVIVDTATAREIGAALRRAMSRCR